MKMNKVYKVFKKRKEDKTKIKLHFWTLKNINNFLFLLSFHGLNSEFTDAKIFIKFCKWNHNLNWTVILQVIQKIENIKYMLYYIFKMWWSK